MKRRPYNDAPLGCFIATILIVISTIPAWFTHIVVCIREEQWLFLIAGAIAAPIAVIHGWGIWLGIF